MITDEKVSRIIEAIRRARRCAVPAVIFGECPNPECPSRPGKEHFYYEGFQRLHKVDDGKGFHEYTCYECQDTFSRRRIDSDI